MANELVSRKDGRGDIFFRNKNPQFNPLAHVSRTMHVIVQSHFVIEIKQ